MPIAFVPWLIAAAAGGAGYFFADRFSNNSVKADPVQEAAKYAALAGIGILAYKFISKRI